MEVPFHEVAANHKRILEMESAVLGEGKAQAGIIIKGGEAMTTFRARYDGKVIVPDEPVDLPMDEPIELQYKFAASEKEPFRSLTPEVTTIKTLTSEDYQKLTIEERLERLNKVSGHINGVTLPEEAYNRDTMYDERL